MPQLDKTEEQTGLDAVHCCDTAKRQQILEGARRIFLQDGFDGASIGDIVRAAGVSKGTVYAYFPSKEKLFEALMVEDRRNQAEALFTIDENDRDVAAVLRRLGLNRLRRLDAVPAQATRYVWPAAWRRRSRSRTCASRTTWTRRASSKRSRARASR